MGMNYAFDTGNTQRDLSLEPGINWSACYPSSSLKPCSSHGLVLLCNKPFSKPMTTMTYGTIGDTGPQYVMTTHTSHSEASCGVFTVSIITMGLWCTMQNLFSCRHTSMGWCKKDVTTLQMHWSNVFLALASPLVPKQDNFKLIITH